MTTQYISNKMENSFLTIDHSVHNNSHQMERINQINSSILARLAKNPLDKADYSKLFSDPAVLGRYKNYRGASSDIANYIRNLDPVVRAVFVLERHPPRWKSCAITDRKGQQNLKQKIQRMNQFQSDQTGRQYYDQSRKLSGSPKLKLPAVSRYYRNPQKLQIVPKESRTLDLDTFSAQSMHQIIASQQREADMARFYLEAILSLRDRQNESQQIELQGVGDGIGVATSVLELLKKQFPKNEVSIQSEGNVNDVTDFEQSTLIIKFKVTEYNEQPDTMYSYVHKYIQQLITYEKSKQKQPEQQEQTNKRKGNRIPKNYEADELETEGLHGFAEAFNQKRERRDNPKFDDGLIRGEVKKRGQGRK